MIQRIQTVFLFIAALAFAALFKFPFATSDISAAGFLSDRDYDIYDSPVLLGMTVLGMVIALSAIFLYKNRSLQIRLSYLVIVVGILLIVVAAILFFNQGAAIEDTVKNINDAVGLYMPVLAFIAGFLAARYINKDEKLIKSMDRLR